MKTFLLYIFPFTFAAAVCADVQMAELFNSHMVLQRDAKVPVWGTADPGEKITVTFNGQNVSTVADPENQWEVQLFPMKHGGPFTLTVQGNNKIVLDDVLVGDVWIVSGQSNTPWGSGTKELLPSATEIMAKTTTVRHGKLQYLNKTNEYPDRRMNGRVVWSCGDPKNSFALPVFFLYPINLATGIPQGFVLTAMAGTTIEPWISMKGYDSVEGLDPFKEKLKILRPGTAEYKKHSEKQFAYIRQWQEQAKENDKANMPVPALEIPPRVHATQQNRYPTCLYNGCIAPLVPMAIKGFFWYQGESNVGDKEYQKKLVAFTNGIREDFRNPDLNFFIVEPCPCKNYGTDNAKLAELWEQQQAFADSDGGKSYVTVTGDIGDVNDLHPGGRSKEYIASRLSNLALKHLYGKNELKADFPRCEKFVPEADKLVLTFKYAEKFHSSDGKDICHFEIAGSDGKYYPAKAEIFGNQIILSSDKVANPHDARYCWSNVAVPNLYNEVNLPPISFRTSKKVTGSD